MKQFFFIVLLAITALAGCSKKSAQYLSYTDDAFVDSAFDYLHQHVAQELFDQLSMRNYLLLTHQNNSNNHNPLLLIYFKDGNRFVALEKQENIFTGNIVAFTYTHPHSGTLLTEDITSRNGHRITFSNGVVTRIEPTLHGRTNAFASMRADHSMIEPTTPTVPLTAADHYSELPTVYFTASSGASNSADFYSVYYLTNFNDSYYYTYTTAPVKKPADYGGSTTSSTGKAPLVDVPLIPAANKPIAIAKELECFGIVKGAVYYLRINVNQPEPSTRTVINTNATRAVGHTYITLEQQNPDGSIIIRNVGWYPRDFVKPTDGLKIGTYQDDSQTPYSVSMTVSVSATEFMAAKNYLTSVKFYGLQEANCTTIGINTFAKANVMLPRTTGIILSPNNSFAPATSPKYPLFSGVNPGDLGEDIRALNATTFSQQNGHRKVTIEKNNANNKTRTRKGNCQ